jgi:eukaryotic-like serine/threonine-protein kinase
VRSSAPESLRSGEISNRYAIEGEIGRGGTAVVYRARDRVRGMDVAIKMMRADVMGSLSIERFLLEIRQTARLPHPHIVPVLDSGEIDGRPYFVLPFMDGGTLREYLLRQKQLPFAEVVALGVTIARALEFAHAHGVIHRDVKPENILYNNGQACLADFGTARALERAINDPTTSTGVVRGTAAYMSPEQASGDRDYDGRTDVYSLACVLYECIAGIQPFVGPTIQSVISQRVTHAPRPVSVYRPTVPPALEQALQKATATQPVDRFQSAGEFAEALEKAAASAAVARDTPPAVILRTTRARKTLVLGLAAASVAGAAWIALASGAVERWRSSSVSLDTTRIVILPFETSGDSLPYAAEDLLYEGFRHWSGLTINETYETKDAIRQVGGGGRDLRVAAAGLSVRDAGRVARRLGAGRYVRGRIVNALHKPTIRASVFDVRSDTAFLLYEASLALTAVPEEIFEVFASLADSLVLRARGTTPPKVPHRSLSNVASRQALLRARGALDDWNLPLADSLFAEASELDSLNAPAHLWRTQVRSWRGLRSAEWGSLNRVNLADTVSLSATERRLGQALVALDAGEFVRACEIYDDVVRRRPNDFAGLYGRGECRRLDRLVVPDPRSPSRWAFRGSRERAIQAFAQALEVLPSSSRAIEIVGVAQLRLQLFTDALQLLGGRSIDGKEFQARMGFDHDTVVFVPYSLAEFAQMPPDPTTVRAVIRNRGMFAALAQKWTRAMPRSAGAKEAQAIALEMVGDESAADSFAVARAMSVDPRAKTRLAVSEALARVKFAISDKPAEIPRAVAMVNSLLLSARPVDQAEAELFMRLAALTGRCRDAGRFAVIAAPANPLPNVVIPPSLKASTYAAHAAVAAGCVDTTLPPLADALEHTGVDPKMAALTELTLFNQLAAMRYPRDGDRIRAYSLVRPDYMLTAQALMLDGRKDSARAVLARFRPIRQSAVPGTIMPDVALTESRLWIDLGDTVTAAALLDQALSGLRYQQPLPASVNINSLRFGSIAQLTELRASIAPAGPTRSRWITATRELWKGADEPLRSRATRLDRIR